MEVDKYEVLEKIGQGSFGLIRKVKRKSDGYILCRKEISYLQMSQKEREQLQSELQILKNLRHPNIVAYYEREHLKASSDLHIYMEYCKDGDLGRRIKELKRNSQMAEEDFIWSVFTQLALALYRCHYGEDCPEVGRNMIGLGQESRPAKAKASAAMILHRDLKPENVFISTDSSIKLGDFGLSKIMPAQTFASTYVGTPFYMSPEICAAEQYNLYSDIWAFGCVMYELCAKEPPFNAKTHLELIQKIRQGRVKPLPSCYSQDLQTAITSCLRTNYQCRPDTWQLLNLPMTKLKRKELEIVQLGSQMRTREEQAARTLKQLESRIKQLDEEKNALRLEIDNTVRREWEVKARLEIDRQVQQATEKLQKEFEAIVRQKVEEELGRRSKGEEEIEPIRSSTPNQEEIPLSVSMAYHQSLSTTGETDDFPSSTDLSELSMESPVLQRPKLMSKKTSRTPFGRAQTMFVGSPMDVQMADPSPAPIASLNLSPRRGRQARPSRLGRNLFTDAAINSSDDEQAGLDNEEEDDDDDDENSFLAELPSPTRGQQASNDPFKAPSLQRPGLYRQKTLPAKPRNQTTIFATTGSRTGIDFRQDQSRRNGQHANASQLPKASASPTRRVSKSSSATTLIPESGSPVRKAPAKSTSPSKQPVYARHRSLSRNTADVHGPFAAQLQGRTLVELAQARTNVQQDITFSDTEDMMRKHAHGDLVKSAAFKGAATVWDPERDEMPSPFLVRGSRNIIPGTIAAPGMRHLR